MKIPPTSSNNIMASRAVALVGNPTDNGTSVAGNKTKVECFQAEREKFLNDFEKPTQIYRFMRTQMLCSPLFLHRNLTYMKNRMSRSHKTRQGFKVDNLLKMLQDRKEKEEKVNSVVTKKFTKNFLNLIVLGFSDGQQWTQETEAKIDLQVVRICMKKRKESQVPISRAFSSTCSIKVRSSCTESVYKDEFTIPIAKGKYPVVSVPKESFNLVNGHIVQQIKLIVRVSIPASGLINKSESARNQNGTGNFDEKTNSQKINGSAPKLNSTPNGLIRKLGPNINNSTDVEEPKPKRQRSIPQNENFVYGSQPKPNARICGNQNIVYVGILTVYDRDCAVNIPAQGNADLEFFLTRQETKKNDVHVKRVGREETWEKALEENNSKISGFLAFPTLGQSAKLALALRVSNEKMEGMVDPPAAVAYAVKGTEKEEKKEDELMRVVYQFVQGNVGKQMTESRNDLRCPWCSINCLVLYSLLKHLKICHSRFNFTYSPILNGARIDVSVNESYDGSYSGSAFDLVAQPPGEAFARNGPAKRTQVFFMIVFRPPPLKRTLQEFYESDEKDAEQRRSYMTGHNRLYHHTTTCLPIHPREIDVDSEGEPDPEWLKVKTCMMIDEFTDVNEGEKEIMKMWNHHVMHDNYVGDCQIPLACRKFVTRYGKQIVEKNLYRNFALHLTNLYDFGLLPALNFHETVQLLHSQMKENNTAATLRDSWKTSSSSNVLALTNGVAEDMEVDSVVPANNHHSNGRISNGNHTATTTITNGVNRNGHVFCEEVN